MVKVAGKNIWLLGARLSEHSFPKVHPGYLVGDLKPKNSADLLEQVSRCTAKYKQSHMHSASLSQSLYRSIR